MAPALTALPAWVAADPLVQKYAALLGPLPWATFPERPADRPWPGPAPQPRAPFVAAFLVKLHEDIRFMADLRTFLVEHPALVVWLGFPRRADPASPYGFAVAASVPDRRQFSRVLRTLPSATLPWLLSASITPPSGHPAARPAGHVRGHHRWRYPGYPRLGPREQPQTVHRRGSSRQNLPTGWRS